MGPAPGESETVTHVRLLVGLNSWGKAYVGYTIGHAFRCFTFPRSWSWQREISRPNIQLESLDSIELLYSRFHVFLVHKVAEDGICCADGKDMQENTSFGNGDFTMMDHHHSKGLELASVERP